MWSISGILRLLFDQNAPRTLADNLPGHEIVRAVELGWDQFVNGELIAAAEEAGFDVVVTADKNWRYQQNLRGRRIGIVVLPTNLWPHLRNYIPEIATSIEQAGQGAYLELELPRQERLRRPPPERKR